MFHYLFAEKKFDKYVMNLHVYTNEFNWLSTIIVEITAKINMHSMFICCVRLNTQKHITHIY